MVDIPEKIKRLYREGSAYKNYRICIVDSERSDITNANIVAESMNINEKLCSSSKLKFGLCEGSTLEFRCFDIDDVSGCRLQVFHEIACDASVTGSVYREDIGMTVYPVPLGFYDVKTCITDAATGIMKVTAYNKLQSDYLDQECIDEVKDIVSKGEIIYSSYGASVHKILSRLLSDYYINTKEDTSVIAIVGGYEEGISGCKLYDANHNIVGEIKAKLKGFSYSMPQEYVYCILKKEFADVYGQIWKQISQDYKGYCLLGKDNTFINIEDYFLNSEYSREVLPMPSMDFTEKISFNDAKYERIDLIKEDLKTDDYCGELLVSFNIYYFKEISILDDKYVIGDIDFSNYLSFYKRNLSEIEYLRLTNDKIENIKNATLREIQSAVFETQCQFGQLSRTTDLFSGIELNYGGLYPADTLYPNNSLVPAGAVESTKKALYQSLYTNDQAVEKFKYLIITYKALNDEGNEVEKTLQRTVNTDGTQNYNMSDNWLFKNLVWTADEVGAYADAMVSKMRNLTWFPFDMELVGLPYVEVGDMLEINTRKGTYNSYVLERNIKGIQNLEDNYSNGTVYTF